MKTKLLTAFILLSTIISFAQSQTSQHLTFKGVPIDGTLDEYVSKLKKSGFTEIGTENGVANLKGDFASFKDCVVQVSTLTEKDLLSKITVVFPTRKTWSSLVSDYLTLKELLTEKYDQPSECIENFSSYNATDDGSKMMHVHSDHCKYVTTYKTDKGSIQLSIKSTYSSAFVTLAYSDKINNAIIKKKAKEDL